MDDEVRKVIFFGDWHGVGKYTSKALYRLKNSGEIPDGLVHVGDFGFSTRDRYVNLVNTILKDLDREMLVVPGNHEDYDYLDALPFDDRGFQVASSNVFVVPRGHRWEWSGVTFAGLGGAYSVDRRFRSRGRSWWPQEEITEDDYLKTVAGGPVDVLVTHEAPWRPPTRSRDGELPFSLSRKEERQSKKGRDLVARTIVATTPKLHVHGHWHRYYEKMFRDTTVVGLDRDGAPYLWNSLLVDLEDLKLGKILVD